jgi:catechol 2,3-dioxygenase-like lactoylglutathione lyase family enzyme
VATKINFITIPVNPEELDKVRDFFVNVMGLHEAGREVPRSDPKTEAERRLPDHCRHLFDDNNIMLDLVAFDNRPVVYAEGIGSGKGISIGIEVDDIKKTWKSALRNSRVKPILDPVSYPKNVLESIGLSEGYFAFFAVDAARISDDGPEQIIGISEKHFLGKS